MACRHKFGTKKGVRFVFPFDDSQERKLFLMKVLVPKRFKAFLKDLYFLSAEIPLYQLNMLDVGLIFLINLALAEVFIIKSLKECVFL
jgi:hypothetical protein